MEFVKDRGNGNGNSSSCDDPTKTKIWSKEEEDDLLLKRLEAAITTCESKMKSASSEDDLKALSVDVDYIYEKLDSVSCIHPTKDQKRKEKRKMLVKRVTSIASVIDSKK